MRKNLKNLNLFENIEIEEKQNFQKNNLTILTKIFRRNINLGI